MLRRRGLLVLSLTFTFRFGLLSVGAPLGASLVLRLLQQVRLGYSGSAIKPCSLVALPSRVVRVELRGEDKD